MEKMKATQTIVDDSLRETKMHGTEGFPLAVYLDDFADFENGYICWHWHEEVQVTMIIEGAFLCQIEAEQLHLKEGDIVFINSGLMHQIRPCMLAQGKLYSFIWRGELIGNTRGSDIYKECVEPVLTGNLSYMVWDSNSPSYQETQVLLKKVVNLFAGRELTYQLQIVILLSSLWLQIFEKMPKEKDIVSADVKRDKQRVKAALQYMQENYQESLKLDDIANAAYISRSELCRGFQRTLQMTPMEFLMQYRIRQSTVLLKNMDLRILDIAEMTGFSSPSHFGSYFRKYMGCTPREYRKGC